MHQYQSPCCVHLVKSHNNDTWAFYSIKKQLRWPCVTHVILYVYRKMLQTLSIPLRFQVLENIWFELSAMFRKPRFQYVEIQAKGLTYPRG